MRRLGTEQMVEGALVGSRGGDDNGGRGEAVDDCSNPLLKLDAKGTQAMKSQT